MDGSGNLLLFQELAAKIDALDNGDALAKVMGEILHSLLRRKGDAEFLGAVQDSFIAGLAGRDLDGRKRLAREVIRVVIDVRPEIASAWQILYGTSAPEPAERRRASDRTAADGDLIQPATPALDAVFASGPGAQRVTALFMGEMIEHRLTRCQPAETRSPTVTYCHGQPFFLFAPAFPAVVRDFITGPIMELCRSALESRIHPRLTPLLGQPKALEAALTEIQADIWEILGERLGELAALHRGAEAKLAAGAHPSARTAGAADVEIPAPRPKVLRVLGIEFTIGKRADKRRVPAETQDGGGITAAELDALNLMTRLRDMAAIAGLELPEACDFEFLRLMVECDAKGFSRALQELSTLADEGEAGRARLFDRLRELEEVFPDPLIQILALILFFRHGDDGFGFGDLYALGMEGTPRPLIRAELSRRPRELAFQLREALKGRADMGIVDTAATMLLAAWRSMAKDTFAKDLDAALTVFTAFPMVFAGDRNEPAFSEISHILYRTLTANAPDSQDCLTALNRVYAPVVAGG